MNKLQIKLIFLFLVFLITSCSYDPIFSQKNYNIKIEDLTLSGEKEINKIIENQLSVFRSVENNDDDKSKPKALDTAKIYSIKLFSELNKVIVSKDSKGDPQKFEKVLVVNYEVFSDNDIVINREIEEKYAYNNDNDKFKLEETENIIIENLAQNITSSIISSIINIDDN